MPSKPFLTSLILLASLYAGWNQWLNSRYIAENDKLLGIAAGACYKPAGKVPKIEARFYFPAGSWK